MENKENMVMNQKEYVAILFKIKHEIYINLCSSLLNLNNLNKLIYIVFLFYINFTFLIYIEI